MTNDTVPIGLHFDVRGVGCSVDEWTEQVTVRSMQADDVERLRRLFFRLSPETVLLRFFQPVRAPSEQMLHHFAEVDHDAREALVAEVNDEIVAVVRYDRTDDPTCAEVAILVEDAWQGHGLGKLLLRRLTTEALSHGIDTLTATVLGENHRALGLAHRLAPTMHSHLDHGEWYVDIPLKSA